METDSMRSWSLSDCYSPKSGYGMLDETSWGARISATPFQVLFVSLTAYSEERTSIGRRTTQQWG